MYPFCNLTPPHTHTTHTHTHTHTHTQAARRMETSRQAANNADTTYQESVRNLEESRQLWEREMEILCKVGQYESVSNDGP